MVEELNVDEENYNFKTNVTDACKELDVVKCTEKILDVYEKPDKDLEHREERIAAAKDIYRVMKK